MPAVSLPESVPRRRSALALVLAAGVMLPLAGCGSAPEDDQPAGVSGAAQDAPETGRAQVAGGGTLRWAVDGAPKTLNAFRPSAGQATDRVAEATLPALFTLDSRGEPQTNPDFLRSAEVAGTSPRQTVVYELNPEARWSDGRPVGVADFKAQWKALSGKDKAYKSVRNAGYDRIRQISAGPGAHQVKVTFARPYADWQSLFTPLYPASVMGDSSAFNKKARTSLPAYAGPFRVKSVDGEGKGSGSDSGEKDSKGKKDSEGKNGDSGKNGSSKKKGGKKDASGKGGVILERNPHWWGDKAKLDRIELRDVPRGKREAALTKGELDLAEVNASAAHRIGGVNARPPGGAKSGDRGAPAPGPNAPQGGAAQKAAMHPAAASMQDWAEAHMSEKALKKVEKEEKAREKKQRAADRKARAAERARAAENRQLRGYTVRKALGPAYTQLALNGESGPLQDERVRRAVARAIDRSALAQHAVAGTGLPAKPLGSHLLMPDQQGYSDNSAALGGADVQAAQELLADSGWKGAAGPAGSGTAAKAQDGKPQDGKQGEKSDEKKSDGKPGEKSDGKAGESKKDGAKKDKAKDGAKKDGAKKDGSKREGSQAHGGKSGEAGRTGTGVPVRMKDGESLTLRFVVPSGPEGEQLRADGERISRKLGDLGIRTETKKVPAKKFFSDHIGSGDYDLALYSWPASAYPATDGRPLFAKPQPAADGSLLVEQNYTRVGTDQIDQLFDRAAGELDEENRGELIKRADARIWAAAGSVPLYQKPQLVAAKDRLANAGAFGFATPRYQDIGYRKG